MSECTLNRCVIEDIINGDEMPSQRADHRSTEKNGEYKESGGTGKREGTVRRGRGVGQTVGTRLIND